MRKLFKSRKFKKILTISLVTLLAIGTLGVSLAFFGRDDFNKAKDAIKDAIVKEEETKENVNLILNSNFQINTTGKELFDETTNASNETKLVDNWRLNIGTGDLDFTMYQVAEGLYVRNEGDSTLYISQVIDEGVELCANRELTLTVSIDDVVYSATGILTETNGVIVKATDVAGSHVQIFINDNKCALSVSAKSGANVIFNWVQLEFGNVFTGYVPPVVVE